MAKPRALLPACLAVLSVLLCGCDISSLGTTVKVTDADSAVLIVDITPSPTSTITKCSTFQALVDREEPIFGPGTVEPVSSTTELTCRLTFETNAKTRDQHITESDGRITLSIPLDFWSNFDEGYAQDQGLTSPGPFDADFSLTVEMPGAIVEASDGGQVDGNKIMWNDYEVVRQGISVTSEARRTPTPGDALSSVSPAEASADAEGTRANSGRGFPLRGWGGIAVAALILLAGTAVLAARNRGRASVSGGDEASGLADGAGASGSTSSSSGGGSTGGPGSPGDGDPSDGARSPRGGGSAGAGGSSDAG